MSSTVSMFFVIAFCSDQTLVGYLDSGAASAGHRPPPLKGQCMAEARAGTAAAVAPPSLLFPLAAMQNHAGLQ